MTLRQWYAGLALQGLLTARGTTTEPQAVNPRAREAVEYADALLKELGSGPELDAGLIRVRALRQARTAAITEEREACAREADAEANLAQGRLVEAPLEHHRDQARAQVQCAAWIAKHIRERGGT